MHGVDEAAVAYASQQSLIYAFLGCADDARTTHVELETLLICSWVQKSEKQLKQRPGKCSVAAMASQTTQAPATAASR